MVRLSLAEFSQGSVLLRRLESNLFFAGFLIVQHSLSTLMIFVATIFTATTSPCPQTY